MKSVFKLFGIIVFIAVILFVVTACDNDTNDDESNVYPYTQHGIGYIGYKSGLYSWSSDQEFDDALNEVRQAYIADYPSSADDVTSFNDVTYDIISWEYITGEEPEYVWDAFWQDLSIYNYFSIGSCWISNYVEIPSKKNPGTIYVISAIITDSEGGGHIRYWSSKGILYPVESRSILGLRQADETPYLLHGKNGNTKAAPVVSHRRAIPRFTN